MNFITAEAAAIMSAGNRESSINEQFMENSLLNNIQNLIIAECKKKDCSFGITIPAKMTSSNSIHLLEMKGYKTEFLAAAIPGDEDKWQISW